MKKRILILGAGNAQIDLINYCRSIGLETFGCSYTNTDTGISLLDHFAQINIVDADAIKAYALQNQIDYIYSVGSDIAVPTICKVAEDIGTFHFVSHETADICCNKHKMRQMMGDSKFNLPFVVCSSFEGASETDFYPVMLKPVDSQGQRGVYLIHNEQELKAHFVQSIAYSKAGKVILEKYVDGDEVSVNAYVKDGQVIFQIISDRISFERLPGGIIKSHTVPSIYENTPTADKIRQLVCEAVEKLKICNGPAYFQIKICSGEPFLIEATPRLDGCHMWNLIHRYTGVNLLELTVRQLLGEDVQIADYQISEHPMHLEFFCEPPETLFDEHKFDDYVSDYRFLYYCTGDKVKKLNGYMEKCGYRIYSSPHRIGVVGGSGMVGRSFIELYKNRFELVDISRTSGMVNEYSCEQLEKALAGCDSVIILAAKKVNLQEEQSPALYNDNIRVVENTLKACKKLGIHNIVFTSTRCVYDNEQPVPISETGLINPINEYGMSKYMAEQVCMHYNDDFGFNIKILRLAQIIGKVENGYMMDAFIKNALSGQPLTVYGNAVGKRDYIYVKDVCRALMLSLMQHNKRGIYNIGSGKGTNAKELALAVIKGFDSPSECVMLPNKPEDTSVLVLDTSKAKAQLGFSCELSLTDSFRDLKDVYL